MSKFEKASEDVVKTFEEVRNSTSIPQWIEFEVLSCNKQKQLYKIVKLNEMVETLCNFNIVVVFNEEILEQLTVEQQKMAINECLAGVTVSDTDVVSVEKPNFSTYRGVLEKYGHAPIISLHESIKSLFDLKKQNEDVSKAQTKDKKSKKKSFNVD